MSYYPEPDSHIRDKVKVVLNLPNYATEKELEDAKSIGTSDLAAKKYLIALKTKVDKLNINELANVTISLNNFKTKADDLDVVKLKTVSVDFKKLSDAKDNEVVKNPTFNTLKRKVSNLDKKIPDATTLIHINQYNTDKQNLEKIADVDKKIPDIIDLVTTTVLNTKISEVDNKISNTSNLGTTTVLNTKISEVENKIPDNSKYITTEEFIKLTAENFAAKLKQTHLGNKTDFDNKLTSFNREIASNKTKHLEVQKKLNSLITKDYNFFLVRILQVMMNPSTHLFIKQGSIN